MDSKPLTAKIGNWQETVALQKMMDGQVYDPRVRSSSTLTKLRVINHSDHIDPKDFKTTLGETADPRDHRDYVRDDGKGPRQRRMEAAISAQISAEEKQREDDKTDLSNQRFMVTTNQADFNGSNFSNSKLGSNPNAVKRRDPYYVRDAPITYYLHTALHGDNFDFPCTYIGSVEKIWLKGTSFTQASDLGFGKKSETYENSSVPPTIRELQVLKKLRYDIVTACAAVSPAGAQGGAVQTLTQKLLDLDTPAGRAPVESIARVVSQYTGVELTARDQDALVIAFSRMNDPRIILIECIEYIRGGLSARAKEHVFRVWDACSPNGREFISEEELMQGMNSSVDKEVMNSILDSLHLYSCGRDEGYDIVDLIEYYRDVYAELGDDEDFVELIKATWSV